MRGRRARAPLLTLLLLGAALACSPAAGAAQVSRAAGDSAARALARDPELRAAERAAREWLYLLDEASYEQAWSLVAPAMQSLVGYREWTTSLMRLRVVLPVRLWRGLLRAERSVPLFGGSSVILSFAVGRGELREIVVLVRTPERWLVGGYGILRH